MNFPDPADDVTDEENTILVGLISDSREQVENIADRYVYYEEPKAIEPNRYDYDPAQRHRYQVRQTADGLVMGQIIIPTTNGANRELLANNNVFLLKNGQRIENQVSMGDGGFSFVNAKPGVYGLVAAGPAGYTAFQFEVLPPDAIAKDAVKSMSKAGYVATSAAIPIDVLPVLMIPPEMASSIIKILRNERFGLEILPDIATDGIPLDGFATEVPGSTLPGYGLGGGGGGFVSGGGGGGGLGGIGGLGAVGAAIAAAVAISDDDGVQAPFPASPLVP